MEIENWKLKITLFVDPLDVLNQLTLSKDMTAADFGAGSGGWVLPLARKLEHGRVFAVDVLEEPLSALEGKARLQGLANVKKVIADVERGIKDIADFSCDLVLMTNLLFQVEDKTAVFKEAYRILKQGGRVLVVDWKVDAVLGPKEGKVSQTEIKEISQKVGFELDKEFPAGIYHYGLIFRK